MVRENATPISPSDRIDGLGVIRGIALFGVLWMNLRSIGSLVPPDIIQQLPTAAIDPVVGLFGSWLASGKAQALFSISFGFGFAMLVERAEARGASGSLIYIRRLAILFAIGLANWLLLWFGDILHFYAAIGLLLFLVRKWPDWLLLAVALAILACSLPILRWWTELQFGSDAAAPWHQLAREGAAARWEVFKTAHYADYVRENFRFLWLEYYTQLPGLHYASWTFARFLLGVWIYRKGWVQRAVQHRQRFLFWSVILLSAGLVLAGVRPWMSFFDKQTLPEFQPLARLVASVGQLLLPLGYAALVMAACQHEGVRKRLAGFGAAGRMALTNYVMQSMVFNLGLYGIGLALLPYASKSLGLVAAIALFAAQIAFSRWWLARFNFGPLEWLWRSGTYWEWQPLGRRASSPQLKDASEPA